MILKQIIIYDFFFITNHVSYNMIIESDILIYHKLIKKIQANKHFVRELYVRETLLEKYKHLIK